MADVEFSWDDSAMIRVVGEATDNAAYRAAQRARGRAMSNIHALGRIDTGRMIGGLQVRRVGSGGGLTAEYELSSSAPYTAFQEFGTRAHGPVRAKAMRFRPKGGGGVVFATWVRGVTPGHFLTNAFRDVRPSDYEGTVD